MSDPTQNVITRFAPSPTGELHIGGARTALFAWAYAKRHGGSFLLRFEDTDQKRSSKQAEQNILRDLEWLGLRGDNHDAIPRQSERLDLYNTALDKLKAAGLTYEDDGAVRFRMDKPVAFDDAVFGHIAVEEKDLEDFVIQKADGFPTFHLAVVVDDADMGVTHVIRGQEHLSNTTKHAALYDALGEPRPVWCHTPSIMNPDGSKMSKRDKAKLARQAAKQNAWPTPESIDASRFDAFMGKDNDDLDIATAIAEANGLELPEIYVDDFRRSGYTVPVLLNYLALLGWNPGNDLERFDLHYLCEHFDFDRIGKSNSKFDRDKLAAFSQDTFLQMPEDEWIATLKAHFEAYFPNYIEKLGDGFGVFAMAYKERSKTLSDPAELGKFFVEAPAAYVPKAVKKNLTKNEGEGLKSLAKVRETLAALPEWKAEPIHASLDELWQTLELKNMGGVAQPLRVALTGNAVSPEIGPTLEILGRDETLQRIDNCLAAHPSP
ncbi:glutamate--tRNA ligase [Algisphaera agarilytica]|uniref:Glutamate--tRNA ligase n=1 Tax=Algisphaera agarilytica TaxID=1385975 RepID=A0A7X0HBY3_9BACT|nr:glutamate--tRNA ligase family protein [Algisphaera agarilytica]MBB6431560.1 glutamyl/glutaminyl-tRNA synthetase [Algisphaera agarilytica]